MSEGKGDSRGYKVISRQTGLETVQFLSWIYLYPYQVVDVFKI